MPLEISGPSRATTDARYAARGDIRRTFSIPGVMATPPTVTLGTVGANPTIPTPQDVPWNSPLVRFFGGRSVQLTAFSTNYLGNAVNSDGLNIVGSAGAQYAEPPFYEEFMLDDSVFEVAIKSQTASPNAHYRIWVDGSYATANVVKPSLSGGSRYYLKTDFTTRAIRHVRLELSKIHFGGLKISASGSVWIPNRRLAKRAVFLGDSITAGQGGDSPIVSWAQQAAQLLGWEDVRQAGQAGTGWLNNAGGANGLQKFADRFTADVVNQTPDVAVFFGGINDLTSSGFSVAQLQARCAIDFAAIKAMNIPEVYIVGCWRPTGGTATEIDAAIAAMKTEAQNAGLTFIDPTGWITGTGKVGATTGSGNGDVYLQNDGVHPTDLGHAYIARRFAEAVTAIRAA